MILFFHINLNFEIMIAIISICLSVLALYISFQTGKKQNFESHFETCLSVFCSLWLPIEDSAKNNKILGPSNGNSWTGDIIYMNYFINLFKTKDLSKGNIIILEDFVMIAYAWGSMFLHLHEMIDNSSLSDEEKMLRSKTVNNLLSVNQRRLLYLWCLLSVKNNNSVFKKIESVENSDGTQGVFAKTREWLKENSWEIFLEKCCNELKYRK